MVEVLFGEQVQQQWFSYTEKVDRMIEEAFRLNVKWSLQELARAINGDGKSGPNPLFKVQVILENDKVGLFTRVTKVSYCSLHLFHF